MKSSGTAPADCPSPTVGNVMDFTYNFDQDWGAGVKNNGNVASINNNRNLNRGQRFTYDELNRVKDAWTAGSLWGNSYVYDLWGNLNKKLACLPGSPCAGYPQGENLDQTSNTKNQFDGFCYDAAGNLNGQSLCPNLTYTYDAENRLLSTAGVTYTYDGDGRRVKKSNGKLYWTGTGSEPLAETDLAGAVQAEYVFFNGKRIARREGSGNTVFYYFSDHLGSASVLTDAAGTIVEESDYYPFGGERVITNNDPNAYKFTGKERDVETGLDYFGARYYHSGHGRFMSPDPVHHSKLRLANPQGWNGYAYALNNPLFFTDPSGAEAGYYYAPDGRMIAPTEKDYPRSDHPVRDTLLLGAATGLALFAPEAGVAARAWGSVALATIKTFWNSPGAQQVAQDVIEGMTPGPSFNASRAVGNFGFQSFEKVGASYVGQFNNGATLALNVGQVGSQLTVGIPMLSKISAETLRSIESGAINAAKGEGAESVKITGTMVGKLADLLVKNGFTEVLKDGKGTGTFVKVIEIKK